MGLPIPHAVSLVIAATLAALAVSCGGRVAVDADDGPVDGGTTGAKPIDASSEPLVELDCQATCAANHPDAFADFVQRWLWRGCEGAGCGKECAATLCADPPEYPTADCTDCILNSSFVVSECLDNDVCAPVVDCWLLCPSEAR